MVECRCWLEGHAGIWECPGGQRHLESCSEHLEIFVVDVAGCQQLSERELGSESSGCRWEIRHWRAVCWGTSGLDFEEF